MKIFGIICLILAVLAFSMIILGVSLANRNKKDDDIAIGTSIGLSLSAFVVFLVAVTTEPIPAIEVYRGNTELQITYQDSIPIDSVVVYKNK